MNELVSVIVTIYNSEKFLLPCIRSILTQTYRNIEVILADDGSTDSSPRLCRQLAKEDERVKYFPLDHEGQLATRIKGLNLASAELIIFSDDDDHMQPDLIESLLEGWDYDLVCSGMVSCNEDGTKTILDSRMEHRAYITEDDMDEFFSNMIFIGDTAERGLIISMCGKLFHKDILMRISDDLDTRIRYGEDRELMYHYVLQCSSVIIFNFAKYDYIRHESSITFQYDPHFFEDANRLRESLSKAFSAHRMSKKLMRDFKRQMWDVYRFGMENKLGYKRGFNVRYTFPYVEKNKRNIVIYGAGYLGRNYIKYIEQLPYHKAVAWADSNHFNERIMGYKIIKPDEIPDIDFDVLWIAILDEKVRNEVEADLIQLGVEPEKIENEKPFCTDHFEIS